MSEDGPRLMSGKARSKKQLQRTTGGSKTSINGFEGKEFPDFPEEEKSKLQQSFTGDELLKRAKQRVGTMVIFIDLNDLKQKFPDSIYSVAKKKVLGLVKEQEPEEAIKNDERVEDMLREAVQDIHKKIMIERSNEYQSEISELKKKLQEALTNYQTQLEISRSDEQISKTKGQLLNEINELNAANRRLQEIVEHLNSDIRQQTEKFRESEKNFKEQISILEAQVKRTQTEQFAKLREDNKKLIQENMDLRRECEKLKEKNRSMGLSFDKMSREEELLRNSLMKELEEVQAIKAQLNNEQKRIDIEKNEMESQKKQLIRQALNEEKPPEEEDSPRLIKGRNKIMHAFSLLDPLSKAAQKASEEQGEPQSASSSFYAKSAKLKPQRTLIKKKTKELKLVENEFEGGFEEELPQDAIADMENIKAALEKMKERRSGFKKT